MKYTLDTIPVLDAFRTDCECPLCRLRIHCEDQYVDSMLSSAYMEPEWRIRSNETGFCTRHFELMFRRRNRLGGCDAGSQNGLKFWKGSVSIWQI